MAIVGSTDLWNGVSHQNNLPSGGGISSRDGIRCSMASSLIVTRLPDEPLLRDCLPSLNSPPSLSVFLLTVLIGASLWRFAGASEGMFCVPFLLPVLLRRRLCKEIDISLRLHLL